MSKFDEEKFYECKEILRHRVENLNMHHDVELMNYLNAYVDQLHIEGKSTHRPRTADEISTGRQRADKLVQAFKHRNGFRVSYDWWRTHNREDDFREKRIREAEANSVHLYLWSKTEVNPAAMVAARDDGLPLEKTAAGALMDKLPWGYADWSSSPTMQRLWEQFSVVFVEGIEVSANAVVLGGVVESSVLTRLEWPHLRKKIEDGSVLGMRVRVMKLAGDPRDSRTWSLETVAGFDVNTQEEFDALPRPSGPEFWSSQKRWHDRQMAGAGNSYDHFDTRGAGASQYSLHDFSEVFKDPTVTVWLSSLEGERELTESPKQLSRAVTSLLKRATTMSSLKRAMTMSSVETSETSESLESESEGDLLSLSTLNIKLTAIQEEMTGKSHETGRREHGDSPTENYVNSLVSAVQEYAPPAAAGVQPASSQSGQPHHETASNERNRRSR
ncbi:hypothetical protein [Streptomyces sp. IB2014 016-6]|uniref:hypothetical protein n=1 Tax=Streptomyces sp. IB2014 016-6 TaxID=2517818 RepID=UPI0011C7E1E7|nr:hypothetical protein [Streptomyces sp. IB2014 016-6]TXL83885.1 hypothetical protein EW053_36155 [Streptomyces sp. IB2014 016-6]